MKKLLSLVIALFATLTFTTEANAAVKERITCVIEAEIHCQGCANKIEKNIAFEKGVKALKINLEDQTVTVTFVKGKNTAEDLAKAITKLGYKAKVKVAEVKPESLKNE